MKRAEKLHKKIVWISETCLVVMILLTMVLGLSSCGIESDDFGVDDCIHSEHFHSDIVVKIVGHTAYEGWIVRYQNQEYTIPFNTPDLRKVECPL